MLRRSAHPDEELRRVYRVHVRSVYAFFGYSVTAEVAEDLTSTTFERVVRAWGSYDPSRASEKTWIMAIARNALHDHWRREKFRAGQSLDEQPALLDALVQAPDAAARLAGVERVKGWLEALKPREREVVALRFGADLGADEIAEALGLSVANVHQISSRALKRLREVAATESA